MGVLVRKRDGAWWVFVNHRGERKANRVGDKETADAVAKKVREALATGRLQFAQAGPWTSHLLSRGWPLLYVQERGGWANATALLQTYARWIPRQAPKVQLAATRAQPTRVTS